MLWQRTGNIPNNLIANSIEQLDFEDRGTCQKALVNSSVIKCGLIN